MAPSSLLSLLCSWPVGCCTVHALEAELSHEELSHGMWGTSHPTMCSDPLTHVHQNASGGSSGASSCCDEVGSSVGSVPLQRHPQHQRDGSQRRGVDGWKAGLAGESSASPGSPMDREGHNCGCWGLQGVPFLAESCSQLSHE